MSDDNFDLPIYLTATDPEGEVVQDKSGDPVRVISWPMKGTSVEAIREVFRVTFGMEIDDERAEILRQGGIVRLK